MGKGDVRYLDIPTAAKQLGVHPETLRLWCRRGRIAHITDRLSPGHPFLIEQQVLLDFKAAQQS